MRTRFIFVLHMFVFVLFMVGCEEKIPDEYGFDQYDFIAFDKENKIAFGEDNNIYRIIDYIDGKYDYTHYHVELMPGTVKQYTGEEYLLTDSGDLYAVGKYGDYIRALKVMDNVKEFSLGGTGLGTTIFALTNNRDLYGWGYNKYGEVGNESPHSVSDPYYILGNVESYFLVGAQGPGEEERIDNTDDVHYFASALTTTGELWTWAPKGSVDGIWVKENNGMRMQLEDVNNFEPVPDGIVATLKSGEEVLVTEQDSNYSEEDEGFWNDYVVNNRWDPVFNEMMVSLNANYYANDLNQINGEIRNNGIGTWSHVQLLFALFDDDGNFIDNTTVELAQRIEPGQVVSFNSGEGRYIGLGVARYELLSINPM